MNFWNILRKWWGIHNPSPQIGETWCHLWKRNPWQINYYETVIVDKKDGFVKVRHSDGGEEIMRLSYFTSYHFPKRKTREEYMAL